MKTTKKALIFIFVAFLLGISPLSASKEKYCAFQPQIEQLQKIHKDIRTANKANTLTSDSLLAQINELKTIISKVGIYLSHAEKNALEKTIALAQNSCNAAKSKWSRLWHLAKEADFSRLNTAATNLQKNIKKLTKKLTTLTATYAESMAQTKKLINEAREKQAEIQSFLDKHEKLRPLYVEEQGELALLKGVCTATKKAVEDPSLFKPQHLEDLTTAYRRATELFKKTLERRSALDSAIVDLETTKIQFADKKNNSQESQDAYNKLQSMLDLCNKYKRGTQADFTPIIFGGHDYRKILTFNPQKIKTERNMIQLTLASALKKEPLADEKQEKPQELRKALLLKIEEVKKTEGKNEEQAHIIILLAGLTQKDPELAIGENQYQAQQLLEIFGNLQKFPKEQLCTQAQKITSHEEKKALLGVLSIRGDVELQKHANDAALSETQKMALNHISYYHKECQEYLKKTPLTSLFGPNYLKIGGFALAFAHAIRNTLILLKTGVLEKAQRFYRENKNKKTLSPAEQKSLDALDSSIYLFKKNLDRPGDFSDFDVIKFQEDFQKTQALFSKAEEQRKKLAELRLEIAQKIPAYHNKKQITPATKHAYKELKKLQAICEQFNKPSAPITDFKQQETSAALEQINETFTRAIQGLNKELQEIIGHPINAEQKPELHYLLEQVKILVSQDQTFEKAESIRAVQKLIRLFNTAKNAPATSKITMSNQTTDTEKKEILVALGTRAQALRANFADTTKLSQNQTTVLQQIDSYQNECIKYLAKNPTVEIFGNNYTSIGSFHKEFATALENAKIILETKILDNAQVFCNEKTVPELASYFDNEEISYEEQEALNLLKKETEHAQQAIQSAETLATLNIQKLTDTYNRTCSTFDTAKKIRTKLAEKIQLLTEKQKELECQKDLSKATHDQYQKLEKILRTCQQFLQPNAHITKFNPERLENSIQKITNTFVSALEEADELIKTIQNDQTNAPEVQFIKEKTTALPKKEKAEKLRGLIQLSNLAKKYPEDQDQLTLKKLTKTQEKLEFLQVLNVRAEYLLNKNPDDNDNVLQIQLKELVSHCLDIGQRYLTNPKTHALKALLLNLPGLNVTTIENFHELYAKVLYNAKRLFPILAKIQPQPTLQNFFYKLAQIKEYKNLSVEKDLIGLEVLFNQLQKSLAEINPQLFAKLNIEELEAVFQGAQGKWKDIPNDIKEMSHKEQIKACVTLAKEALEEYESKKMLSAATEEAFKKLGSLSIYAERFDEGVLKDTDPQSMGGLDYSKPEQFVAQRWLKSLHHIHQTFSKAYDEYRKKIKGTFGKERYNQQQADAKNEVETTKNAALKLVYSQIEEILKDDPSFSKPTTEEEFLRKMRFFNALKKIINPEDRKQHIVKSLNTNKQLIAFAEGLYTQAAAFLNEHQDNSQLSGIQLLIRKLISDYKEWSAHEIENWDENLPVPALARTVEKIKRFSTALESAEILFSKEKTAEEKLVAYMALYTDPDFKAPKPCANNEDIGKTLTAEFTKQSKQYHASTTPTEEKNKILKAAKTTLKQIDFIYKHLSTNDAYSSGYILLSYYNDCRLMGGKKTAAKAKKLVLDIFVNKKSVFPDSTGMLKNFGNLSTKDQRTILDALEEGFSNEQKDKMNLFLSLLETGTHEEDIFQLFLSLFSGKTITEQEKKETWRETFNQIKNYHPTYFSSSFGWHVVKTLANISPYTKGLYYAANVTHTGKQIITSIPGRSFIWNNRAWIISNACLITKKIQNYTESDTLKNFEKTFNDTAGKVIDPIRRNEFFKTLIIGTTKTGKVPPLNINLVPTIKGTIQAAKTIIEANAPCESTLDILKNFQEHVIENSPNIHTFRTWSDESDPNGAAKQELLALTKDGNFLGIDISYWLQRLTVHLLNKGYKLPECISEQLAALKEKATKLQKENARCARAGIKKDITRMTDYLVKELDIFTSWDDPKKEECRTILEAFDRWLINRKNYQIDESAKEMLHRLCYNGISQESDEYQYIDEFEKLITEISATSRNITDYLQILKTKTTTDNKSDKKNKKINDILTNTTVNNTASVQIVSTTPSDATEAVDKTEELTKQVNESIEIEKKNEEERNKGFFYHNRKALLYGGGAFALSGLAYLMYSNHQAKNLMIKTQNAQIGALYALLQQQQDTQQLAVPLAQPGT